MLLLNLYEAQHRKSSGGYYGLFSRLVDCITNAILIRFVEYMNIDCAVFFSWGGPQPHSTEFDSIVLFLMS
jgi:hypothetical protein